MGLPQTKDLIIKVNGQTVLYKVNDVVLFGATLYIAVTHPFVATNPDPVRNT